MKIKYADIISSNKVLEKEFKFDYVDKNGFKGYVGISYFKKVSSQKIVEMNKHEYIILDKDYIWVQYFPDKLNYAVTVMFNENKEVVQWYFDICLGNKLDNRGIPYFYDLYLDVVLLPNREVILLDEDELEEALKLKDITKDQFNLAYNVANSVLSEIKDNDNIIVNLSEKHLKEIEKLL